MHLFKDAFQLNGMFEGNRVFLFGRLSSAHLSVSRTVTC